MDLFLNLKICEACGCLWLRSQLEAGVYCASCYDRLKQFPTVEGRKHRGRRRKTILPTVHAVDSLAPDFAGSPRGASTSYAGGLQ
jgi:hypothetical protein